MTQPDLSETTINSDRGLIKKHLQSLLSKFTIEGGALLVQIPQVPPELVDKDIAKNKGYFAYPPQALLYLSATLRSLGIETFLLDLNYEVLKAAHNKNFDGDKAWKDALDVALKKIDRPFVCVSFMFEPTYPELVKVCRQIKLSNQDACILVGGVAATSDPDRILNDKIADIVFSNEGEKPLENFISFIRNQNKSIPNNISFSDQFGETYHTELTTGGLVDIDIREEYEKIPIADYHKYGSLNNLSRMRGLDVPYATLISRRGCRARCTFCSVRNFNGRSVRIRNTNGVVDEMEFLYKNYNIKHFDWLDDDLLYDQKSAINLFNTIAERLPDITYGAHNGLIAAAITPEILKALTDSGCMGFPVGLETGNPEMLRKIRKPATIETFMQFANFSKEFQKIFYVVNFILGLPEEIFGQMIDSFSLAYKAELDWNSFFTYQQLKNTEAYLVYGGLDDCSDEEELRKYGTTMNFNPVRAEHIDKNNKNNSLVIGYDIFDLDKSVRPGRDQRKEIWFTFNYVVNFLHNPALSTNSTDRLKNQIKWLQSLGGAYEKNAAIDCIKYYLSHRLNELSNKKLHNIKDAAYVKFKDSEYWKERDEIFKFSSFLENEIPEIDKRVNSYTNKYNK